MRAKCFLLWLITAVVMLQGTASIAAQAAPPYRLNPANFVDEVDNRFFPLEPGTTFFFDGEKDGTPSTNITHVTFRKQHILGVVCTVVRDDAYENGVLVERTTDYYAQDREGNVWYFGEDTAELDASGNVVSTEGTWRAGVDGAQPGIIMEAQPRVGDGYDQEVAPGVAEDKAQVLSLNGTLCVPYGCFGRLLVTKEWSPLNPRVVERKYYAGGVGFIFGKIVKGGNEFTELVRITRGDRDVN